MVAAFGVGSIAFMNLSLNFNSVGFYQMMKLLCIPCQGFIYYQFQNQGMSFNLMKSLFVLLVGIGVATITDVEINQFGTMIGFIAVATTAQFQIWQGSKSKQFGMTSIQVPYDLSGWQALLCLVIGLYVDRDIVNHEFKSMEMVLILLSCAIAIGVNLCSFLLIGRTNAITYQVVGHAKTCLVLLGGFFIIGTPIVMKNVAGIVIAMAGV